MSLVRTVTRFQKKIHEIYQAMIVEVPTTGTEFTALVNKANEAKKKWESSKTR